QAVPTKTFNLEHNYGDHEEVLIGGLADNMLEANTPHEPEAKNNLYFRDSYPRVENKNEGPKLSTKKSMGESGLEKYFIRKQQNTPVAAEVENDALKDDVSLESVKTYHTTSTLKEMIERTNKLQKKFENLEEQLAQIEDGNAEKNLENILKTYNAGFNELNIDSNDSDFI
ncbi:hypothetical protein ENBRE01_2205, partial [Enteropsectra breve]